MKRSVYLKKSAAIIISLLCMLSVAACSNKSEPTLIPYAGEMPKLSPAISDAASSKININYYIDATPSMEGFARMRPNVEETVFYKTVPSLSKATSRTQWKVGDVTEAFFRFDVPQPPAEEGAAEHIAYEISKDAFSQDTIKTPPEGKPKEAAGFYSIKYYGDDGYYKSSLYQTPYLTNILKEIGDINELNKADKENEQGYLAVLLSEMVELNGTTEQMIKVLCEDYVEAEENMAVGLFAIKSNFDGYIYDMGMETPKESYSGERPFYILTLGKAPDVYAYAEGLKAQLASGGVEENINYNYAFICNQKFKATTGIADITPQLDESLIQKTDYSWLEGTEKQLFTDNPNNLYLEVMPYEAQDAEEEVSEWIPFSFTVPYKLYLDTSPEGLSFNAKAEISRLDLPEDADYDEESKSYIGSFTKLSDAEAAEVLKLSPVQKTEGTNFVVNGQINKELLRDYVNESDAKYKITVKVIADYNGSTNAAWLDSYAFDKSIEEYYQALLDPDIKAEAGGRTLGIREIVETMLLSSEKMKNEYEIADFAFYIKIPQE